MWILPWILEWIFPLFSRKKARKIHKQIRCKIHPEVWSENREKFPSDFCRSLLLTKSETKCSQNAPKRPRKCLNPVQLPKGFSPALFHSFEPAISNTISSAISNFLSLGNGPNTVSESTVSNTDLSEFFGAHWVPGSELSEFLSAYYLCAKANSPSFSQNSPSLPQNSVSSLFRNSALKTVLRPFPRKKIHAH